MNLNAFSDYDGPFSLNCGGKLIELNTPKIMGILNVTPDSFSDGGLYISEKEILLRAERMISEGVDIIDLGAQSTRANSDLLEANVEIKRLGKTVANLKKEFPDTLLSLDTFWSETVMFGFNEGINLINDISAGQYDNRLLETVAYTKLPYVLMHVNSTYENMHAKIEYEDVVVDVNQFLMEKANELHEMGIVDVILDPGFGFGKSIEDQYKLLENVHAIGFGRYPVLVGISRKSFIYKTLNKTPLTIVDETQKYHMDCLKKGASILRVHDIKETKNTINEFLLENNY